MLLFIRKDALSKLDEVSFNTSHVVVYQFLIIRSCRKNLCFNTSHVVVYREHGI